MNAKELYPAFGKNNIAIFVASSDEYAPYVGVVLQSIIESASSENNYDFLVLQTDISDKNKKLLLSMVKGRLNFSLRFVDISSIVDQYTFSTRLDRFSKYNYYRLAAFEAFIYYEKVIYLDCDTVVNCDIAELYNTDVTGNYVAATRGVSLIFFYYQPDNSVTKNYFINELKLKDPKDYFNSGVMVLNMKLIRENFPGNQILYMASSSNYKFCDQDLLNVLFSGKVIYLPYVWNVKERSHYCGLEKFLPKKLYKEYMDACKNPRICHFVGDTFPTIYHFADMKDFFWKHAKPSPYYEELLRITGWEQSMEPEVAIFVSHRIDKMATTLPYPIYHNMRCGAVYDQTISPIPGDDTGDNISEKRDSYNELTVQYWAWKNYESDYYGMCHYRRYLNFNDEYHEPNGLDAAITEFESLQNSVGKYNLHKDTLIKNILKQNDVIVSESWFLKSRKSVRDFYMNKAEKFDPRCFEFTVELVKERQPKYYPYLLDYLDSVFFRGYNCFIMRKSLFDEMCEFEFDILFALEDQWDMSSYTGELVRMPGFMAEMLFGAYIHYLGSRDEIKIHETSVAFFPEEGVAIEDNMIYPRSHEKFEKVKEISLTSLKGQIKSLLKPIMHKTFPAYRVALRNEQHIFDISSSIEKTKTNVWQDVLLANEIHETHKTSFLDFKNCNVGRDVVIVATGPTMKYYTRIENVSHIGMNAAFNRKDVVLDYYFATDYESRHSWFDDLKNYDFIKFFGQYPTGSYRERFQIPEKFFLENKARKFFQGAPSEAIHINIEYYPLMGFYSVVFQAIHFALYTHPDRVFLVGCDCMNSGYFDGSQMLFANVSNWIKGYQKLKVFVQRFYPDIQIISVNPAKLKGLFKDVYTESYLEANPELNRPSSRLLSDFLEKR